MYKPGWYCDLWMPRNLETDADPDALTSIRIEVPGWMKNRVAVVLKARGKSLTDWVKDQMRDLIASADAPAPRGKQKK
jgi:hypothetical protein